MGFKENPQHSTEHYRVPFTVWRLRQMERGTMHYGRWSLSLFTTGFRQPMPRLRPSLVPMDPATIARYEGPNNTDYRPGNTHDRLTADPFGAYASGTRSQGPVEDVGGERD